MNEPLRRALIHARLREGDLAASLGVDPKTVRRWLTGRIPYPRHRLAIAELVGVTEAELWPEAGGLLTARVRPDELGTVYPHRQAIPRDVWARFFALAEQDISILTYSALFLADDEGILHTLSEKSGQGVAVRIVLGDPDCFAVAERGREEGAGEAMSAEIRNALMFFQRLSESGGVQVRLHQTILYNSIYRADDRLLISQHAYGIAAAHSPVFSIKMAAADTLAGAYVQSFERIWASATTLSLYEPRIYLDTPNLQLLFRTRSHSLHRLARMTYSWDKGMLIVKFYKSWQPRSRAARRLVIDNNDLKVSHLMMLDRILQCPEAPIYSLHDIAIQSSLAYILSRAIYDQECREQNRVAFRDSHHQVREMISQVNQGLTSTTYTYQIKRLIVNHWKICLLIDVSLFVPGIAKT